jgi:hypothetical protein
MSDHRSLFKVNMQSNFALSARGKVGHARRWSVMRASSTRSHWI